LLQKQQKFYNRRDCATNDSRLEVQANPAASPAGKQTPETPAQAQPGVITSVLKELFGEEGPNWANPTTEITKD